LPSLAEDPLTIPERDFSWFSGMLLSISCYV